MTFSTAESEACRRLVELAWEEDLGPRLDSFHEMPGDVTSQAIIPAERTGQAVFVARAPGVVAGLPAVQLALSTVNTPLVKLELLAQDGARVQPGDRLAIVSGLIQLILMGERLALNFLQHLSGVATLTRRYLDAVASLPCQILDTRKTTPGWRLLEKYAVRCGGGHNHRMGLYDGILVKDNHLAALGIGREAFKSSALALPSLTAKITDETGRLLGVFRGKDCLEIEVETLDQLDWAMSCFPKIILLDNMPLDQLREAVRLRNEKARHIFLEASGGVTLDTVRAIAETGVDRISVGALTHSAPALDIALDYE
jgi:nicotinate-nucleotide pyrophosphorylase (carboxylating)